ncbi:hypothetical protein [Sphingomonas sp.]|jgi:hypothetical protein|uniref:hypothetical protein n=1 Tax=Sphingomonas sp. TaxID=28214 RepID=UPI002ED8A18A
MSIAALLLAALSLASPEDWRPVEGLDGIGAKFWVDMDSVRLEEGITHFRTRVMIPNFDGFAYVDSVANCTAKTAEMRRLELRRGVTVVKTESYAPGERTQSIDDAQGLILQALICKP